MGLAPIGSTGGGAVITRKSFEQIEDFIRDNEASIDKAERGIDMLVRTMVMVIKGLAQEKSGGPVAARQRSNPVLAFKIPVQRITGAYYAGWKLRRMGMGRWVVYNDTVEAWFIEYGIHQRVRRPILQMSLIGMLKFIQSTRTGDRFLDWVMAPRRSSKGTFQSFQTRMMNTRTLGGMAGPKGNLPG